MFKPTRNIYSIKTSPYNDNEKLENLLNEMSKDGWDLYSMQELENDDDIFYNCIFVKEIENEDDIITDSDGLFNFKPRIERIINPELDPYEMCLEILKKIKDTRQKIAQVKSLIDGTSEDSRGILNAEISKHINELEDLKKNLIRVINPDIMEQKLGEARLTLAISEELTDILDSNNDDNMLAQIVLTRQNLTETLGYIMPKIKIEVDDSLDENEFAIKIRGIPVVKSYAYYNHTMFFENELKIEQLPENSIKSKDAITKKETVWISDETAKDFWIKGLGATDYISGVIEYSIVKYIDDIFDYSDVNRYIEIVSNQNLYLIENIIPDFLSVSELKYILTSLIKEKVSVKDIVYIFEKINDYAEDEGKEDLLAHIRLSLARQISASICTEKNNTIQAYELSDESLSIFNSENEEEVVHINSKKVEKLVQKIEEKSKESEEDLKEIILIAPLDIRHIVYLVLSQLMSNIRVISREELLFEYPLKILGRI